MKALARCLLLTVGLVSARAEISRGQQPAAPVYANDPRLHLLTGFFERVRSPASAYAEDFLAAADRNGLDWRLLPSIAIVESGGGRASRNNNILGWDSGRQAFPSVGAGIHAVAVRLSVSKLYRDKNLEAKLTTYNRNRGYRFRVRRLMDSIAPPGRPAPDQD